jgi:pimeloyl-ACP methyl ester carboxylesterase
MDEGPSTRQAALHLRIGVDVSYVSRGDLSGISVLLLHAWGESLGSFDRVIPLLPRTIRALAMDQRGHGDSDKPADGYSLTDFAGDVTAFLDAMACPQPCWWARQAGGMSPSR